MKRRRFLKHLATTPVVISQISPGQGGARQAAAGLELATESGEAMTLPPWAGSRAEDWSNASKAIMFTDMTQCQPASAFTPRMKKGHWRVIPYVLKKGEKWSLRDFRMSSPDDIKGNIIWASPETGAPTVTLPLKERGWHAIFVGVMNGDIVPSEAWLKLDGDAAPVPRPNDFRDYYCNVADELFKIADLKGESLHIGQHPSGYTRPPAPGCGIAYVKLIPLSPEEIAGLQKDRSERAHRKMTAVCDGYGFIYRHRTTTVEQLLSEMELFRNTDFDTFVVHAMWGGDKVSYPSKYGTIPGLDMDDFVEVGQGYFVEAVRELARKKINPIKVLIEGAHDMGMKVHVGVRPAGWSYGGILNDLWQTPFYRQHPDWRCIDRDGAPTTRMSWAVPEVRQHMIDGLIEAVGFGAEGAHIVFNRGFPVVLYEQPVLEMFQKQHGENPRKLDEETDPRIRKLWSDIITTTMRELRLRLDQEQARRGDGKRLELSAMVLPNHDDNYIYGLDIRRLIDEGLLDEILIYQWGFGGKTGKLDLDFFRQVCKPKGVRFRPSLPIHLPDLKDQIKDGLSFYDGGADGVCMVDPYISDIGAWSSVYSRFGHIEEMRARLQSTKPAVAYSFFHLLDGQVRDGRFPPYWGG